MRLAFCFVAIAISVAFSANIDPNPLSDEFIDLINSKQSTWRAGRNFDENTPVSHIRRLIGALKSPEVASKYEVRQHIEVVAIPESFDARQHWPNCKHIKVIKDQSACGSCWAVSAASAMSDRICIHSNGQKQIYVSDEDLLTCCGECGFGCYGGLTYATWNYWQTSGIVSGGPRNSTTGCRAYSMEPCEHHITGSKPPCSDFDYSTPYCLYKCDDQSSLVYDSDKSYGQKPYSVSSKPEQIQLEIMKNGPIQVSFDVYTDFYTYKSGVYQQVAGSMVGGHAVRIIGWGVERGTPYWLVANSWNEDWGDKGLFKIIRGRNECDIEIDIVASLPKL